MPDPTRKTLSATQTPALFNASPYLTRWMLLRHFIHGDPIDSPEHNRMDWGKKLQPLVLAQAAEDLHLEVRPNAGDVYIRHGGAQLGCTRDAEIICPSRGPGALEIKCVFDHRTWMETWSGGKAPPRHVEIQTQQQMLVGDGQSSYVWGVIGVWVCGEMRYFERQPVPDLWTALRWEADRFFADVEAGAEGEPFGEQVEAPLLAKAFPVQAGKVLDFTAHEKAAELAEQVRQMTWHAEQRGFHEKSEKALKTQLKALIADAEAAQFIYGIRVHAKQQTRAGYTVKPSTFTVLDAFVPDDVPILETRDETKLTSMAGA